MLRFRPSFRPPVTTHIDDDEQPEASRQPLGWCLVANVRRVMPLRDDGTRRPPGTRLFAPGAKLWLARTSLWDDAERLRVVGRHRKSHRYVEAYVKRSQVESFRARQFYDFSVQRMLGPYPWDPAALAYLVARVNDTLDDHVEMLHASGLFAGVLEHPADIAPRAVLADWLCERNDPRGPVLNASCAGTWSDDLEATKYRLERLWLGSVAQYLEIRSYDRGFVSAVQWSSDLTLERATRLARATPLAELHLGVASYPGSTRVTFAEDALLALRSLQAIVLQGPISLDNAAAIVRAAPEMPHLERITSAHASVDNNADLIDVLRSSTKWQERPTTT